MKTHNQASRPGGLMQISLASTFLSLKHFYNLKSVGPLAAFQRLLTWKCAGKRQLDNFVCCFLLICDIPQGGWLCN